VKQVIRIEHEIPDRTKILFVDWLLGNRCNYRCSYCPNGLHSGSIEWVDADAVRSFSRALLSHYQNAGMSVFFQFTGGEPTFHPHFLELARWLKHNGCLIGVLSNGTKNAEWWAEAREYLDNVVLTYHIEFSRLDHFVTIASVASETSRTHVNVAMHPERFDECLMSAEHIARSCPNITITLKPLLIDFGPMLYAYTERQNDILAHTHFDIPRKKHPFSIRGNMKKLYTDGSEEICGASQFLVDGTNHWIGWLCNVGMESLAIDGQGRIYRGQCKVGGFIGTIRDTEVAFPQAPILCTKENCHCLADIMTTRGQV
jgi:organic radical activating enzyme